MYGDFRKAIIAKDPFLFEAISTSVIRNLIRQADLDALEQVVLDGHGQKLIGENASDSKIRTFIKAVPSYMVIFYKYSPLAQNPQLLQHTQVGVIKLIDFGVWIL